jgi:bacterioferritin (cytochrome b1)
MKDAVIAELMQHAADELRHADMVSNRIIQLGGTPITTPKKWFDLANCAYDGPSDPFVRKILEQNIAGEHSREPSLPPAARTPSRVRGRASPARSRRRTRGHQIVVR